MKPVNLKELSVKINRALEQKRMDVHKGRRKESAAQLGNSVRTLQRKIKEFELEPDDDSAAIAIQSVLEGSNRN